MQSNAANPQEYPLCLAPLASYACHPDLTKGRLYDEPLSLTRTPFQRDRDRVIHARAFRRLKHKTQVFIATEGDHYRTRLTHSLEVAQIARSLARALWLNEDLAEICALAHDLGHPPFAHAGEEALQECMKPYGGFDHNDQTLRIVTRLEKRYPDFDGLNLTWESLEGLAKHNGPVPAEDVHTTLKDLSAKVDLQLDRYASLEAQVAGLSDDIAYNSHDLEDGLRAGFFTLDDLTAIPLLEDIIREKSRKYPNITTYLLCNEVVRELYGRFVVDVLDETRGRMKKLDPNTPDDIRTAGQPTAAFSRDMQKQLKLLRAFLMERMYKHEQVIRVLERSTAILEELFLFLLKDTSSFPDLWQQRLREEAGGDEVARARVVVDYVAGMTDNFALEEHERLLGARRLL